MKNINRRDFCKYSFLGLGSLTFSGIPSLSFASTDDNHFFLQVTLTGGWDPSYLFDARPLKMTQNELIQNYLGTTPTPWAGNNGQSCLSSRLTQKLTGYKNDFSIINGVLMATSFDGHGQNMNHLFTGNPFGGESFLPWLAEKSKFSKTAISGITSSPSFVQASNDSGMVPLGGYQGEQLVTYLNKSTPVDANKDVYKFINERFQENSKTGGRFSLTNEAMIHAFTQQPKLYNQLKDLKFDATSNPEVQMIGLMKNLFSKKIARVATLNLQVDNNVDTHDNDSARSQPDLYAQVVDKLKLILDSLKSTPFDNTRSMFDVTTFMIGSEFSRTMRQEGVPFEQTGTDHNSLCNSLIIGGKGIKGGDVIGKSDFQASDEVLQPAHLKVDPKKFKIMGSPFDFTTMKPSQEVLQEIDTTKYLGVPNVVNTLLTLFGVDKDLHWKSSRLGNTAPALSPLIK